MSSTIERSIQIDATPATVWSILTDTNAYPSWNPFMTELAGDLTVGAKLEVRIAPPDARAMTFKTAFASSVSTAGAAALRRPSGSAACSSAR